MKTEATSVLNGRLPEISTSDADLADRARERERDAGEDPREDVREHDAAEDVVSSLRAERARGLLHLAVELEQHRLHRPHDERQRHEEQRERRSPCA